MTLAVCSYVSNQAALPLVAMLIKLMFLAIMPSLEFIKLLFSPCFSSFTRF